MKTSKRKLPQPEFGFAHEPMKLVGDTTTDGERVATEQRRKEQNIEDARHLDQLVSWGFDQMHKAANQAPEIKPYQHLHKT
jgi:hypothetical protein